MKPFKSSSDVEATCLQPQLEMLVKRLFTQLRDVYEDGGYEYRPEDDGFLVLLEEHDSANVPATQYGYTLLNAIYEGVQVVDCCFVAHVLHNNQFGITWIIPDAPWLDKRLRERLLHECLSPETLP